MVQTYQRRLLVLPNRRHLLQWVAWLFVPFSFVSSVMGDQLAKSFQNTIPPSEVVFEAAVLSKRVSIYNHGSLNKEDTTSSFQYDVLNFIETESGVEVLITAIHEIKKVFVNFRGSDELQDWKTNFNAIQTRLGPVTNTVWSSGMVHAGYDQALFNEADGLVDHVLYTIDAADIKSYDLVFSGHSKGGGEALLFGSYICDQELREKDCLVVTFGQPMVGNEDYATYVNDLKNLSVWRFVMSSDPVPRLPPNFYYHAGHLVQLEQEGAKAYYRHYGEDALGLAGAPRGWENDLSLHDAAEVHKMTGYIDYMIGAVELPKIFYVDSFDQ